jgi:hypothetical protein
MEKQEIDQDIINLVIARLQVVPGDAQLSVGGNESSALNVKDLIEEVKNQTEIGKKIIEMQLFYLRSLKDLPIEEYV